MADLLTGASGSVSAETLDLARLQFALTAGGHFLFVTLTLGLATIVACVQTRATISGRPLHARMVRFWGQLYVINYAVGIVTGIVMEFQFGLSWSGLTHDVGNVLGASLAVETIVAFFVESTFLGLWIFGWNRFGKWVHLALIWVVTLTAYLSAYWILVANGFLNHPVGHRMEDGRAVLDDVGALLTNPSALLAFGHILAGSLLTAGFFMAGVSAYHLFRRTPEWEFFGRSLRIGVFVSLPALVVTAGFGGVQLASLADLQPMKSAVFQQKTAEIAQLQTDLAARFGPGDYVPSEPWTRGGALVMLIAFALMMYLCVAGTVLGCFRKVVFRFRLWHVVLMASVPLPYLAMISGWVFREAGRQPWVVYGVLRTRDAVSEVSPTAMRTSLIAFTTLFVLLAVVNARLLWRHARRGPVESGLGHDERAARDDRTDGDEPGPAGPLPATRY
ncbi:cytochrome ubiquinol oxidase subunit I [Streptomyces scopuliridis]|uniref:Cytochrome ubiquinol oxidase subunit I n=1 Tax=Streptomyces scopuliridis TaxID=452529 RepID=A0ACD4ZH10_9ACTN|nr:cytochrome ubiquinol oxidase subunit I [Streptomyces scopuliridis]WSB97301.1 cytochrome ubiquinol oxidase subunit I [Streptomyces scopuliridis]WSC08995.1 cytochrome ubiquinol oxidase subunit I [Streptomyces scopuliridis]